MNAILGIDHALIGVDDLAAAADNWRRLGFTLTPRGRHVGRQTGNHCIMFQRDYLELIGIVDADGPPSRLSDMLRERGEGLIGAAMSPTSAAAALAQFRAAGIEAEPASLERPVDGPSGSALARFDLLELPASATPDFRMFVCDQLTRELVWRPEWQGHANGTLGIAGLAVLAADPPALAAAWSRLVGAGGVNLTDDVLTVFVGEVPVVFARPADFQSMYPQVEVAEDGPLPRGGAMTLRVADAAATARALRAAEVPFESGPRGVLTVPPEAANGVLLEFRPPRQAADGVPG